MSSNYQSYRNQVLQALTQRENAALEAIGLFVEGEAKLRCPVGVYTNGRVGGNLRGSIDHKVVESEKAVHTGTNVEYAIFVEKGTHKQREQPYLTPAVEENISKIKRITEQYLGGLD
jgi:HK97 gp10 family phage protein